MAKDSLPDRIERITLDNGSLGVPLFSPEQVHDFYCARYARLSSRFIFGKEFPAADAWDIRNQPEVRVIPYDNHSFRKFAEAVPKGAITGIYLRDSDYNDGSLKYTHVALYLGILKGNPLFLEQFEREVRLINLSEYERLGYEIKEILDVSPRSA